MASISVRTSIRFLPDPPAELTSTLVLTSPGRHFCDVRFFLPTDGRPLGRCVGIKSVDWAFAGTSSTKKLGDGISHSVWRHWVDSRHVDVTSVVDEGDMMDLPDGSTLEKGTMLNPATGLEGDYEEVWRDIEPSTTRCVVLRLEDDVRGAKGMIVLLGQFCQGVMRVGNEVAIERWEQVGDKWEKSVGLCSRPVVEKLMPHIVALRLGDRIEDGDLVWTVIESCTRED